VFALAAILMCACWPVPLPAGDVTVSFDHCPGQGGACADAEGGRVWLAGELDPFALAHELGHVYLERDLAARADAGYWRGRLMILLGFDPLAQPWDGGTGEDCWGRPCPSEIAADAYAACALRMQPGGRRVGRGRNRRRVGGWETAYGYRPTPRQHRRVCRAIRASGAEAGP
jgi:hypothetical protein